MARSAETQVTNATLYDDGCILIKNVRASYPHLDKPYAGEDGGEPKFGIVGLLDKKTHVAAKELCVKVIDKIMKENDTKVAKDKKFIRDGDDSDKVENEGMWTVSAREARRPSVRNKDATPMTEREVVDIIYGGCYVNILIRPWYQDNKFGKRINAGLVAVQFVRDGEAFGDGRIDDEGVFDEVEDEDDDSDL